MGVSELRIALTIATRIDRLDTEEQMKYATAKDISGAFRAALHRIAQLMALDSRRTPLASMNAVMLESVVETFELMTEIPYRVIDSKHVHPTGTGRQIYRLFEATQLCADWRFRQPRNVNLDNVLAAFNAVANDASEDHVVFPVGNISPAAQRIIKGHIFFSHRSTERWTAYCGANPRTPLLVEHELIGDETISPLRPQHRLHLSPLIRFNRGKGIWETARS